MPLFERLLTAQCPIGTFFAGQGNLLPKFEALNRSSEMNKHILFFAALLLSSGAMGQTGWLKRFSGSDSLLSVQILPDGYAFVANNATHVYRIRVGIDGQQLDSLNLGITPEDIVENHEGCFYKGFFEGSDIRLQKLDTAGVLLWEYLLEDSIPQRDLRLAATPDGGCYVVSATAFQTLPSMQWTRVRRIADSGMLVWSQNLNSFGSWSDNYVAQRYISDVTAFPDTGCYIMSSELFNPWVGGSHWLRLNPEGTIVSSAGSFIPDWGDARRSTLQIVRPTADKGLLGVGHKFTATGGFHPSNSYWGFVARLSDEDNTQSLQVAEYPLNNSVQGFTTWNPDPIAAAPLADGGMLVMGKTGAEAWLWRGSTDLRDTAWSRPLTAAGGLREGKMKRPNRLIYSTPDHGAILGGVDNTGIFLMKIGLWGNDTPAVFLPFAGQIVKDLDIDCQTQGPYVPMPKGRIRLSSGDYPQLQWIANTDSLGRISAYLPPGLWQAAMADSIDAIYGKSCTGQWQIPIADSLPSDTFVLPVLRYTARLKGRAWLDQNGNCQLDEINSGAGGKAIYLVHEGKQYRLFADAQGYFEATVDTGKYALRIDYNDAGIFSGYYCQSTEAYLPDYQSVDSVTLVWSKLANCKIRLKLGLDLNYDCLPATGDWNWVNAPVLLTDSTAGTEKIASGDPLGVIERSVYGPGTLKVAFPSDFGDSLVCTQGLPHTFVYQPLSGNQIFKDTLTGWRPRLHDSVSVCPGTWVFGAIVTHDTAIVTSTSYLGYFNVPASHHIFVLPSPETHLYTVDTTLASDSLQVMEFTAASGCDSIVYIHWTTTGLDDFSSLSGLIIAPNPAQDAVSIQLPALDYKTITLIDPAGKVAATYTVPAGQSNLTLALSGLPPGIYAVQALRCDGKKTFGRLAVLRP